MTGVSTKLPVSQARPSLGSTEKKRYGYMNIQKASFLRSAALYCSQSIIVASVTHPFARRSQFLWNIFPLTASLRRRLQTVRPLYEQKNS